MIARNELLALFWPEEPDQIARLRLRETLNKLRQALPKEEILLTKDNLVGLDFDNIYVDLLEFRELTMQVGRLPWKIPPEEPLPNTLYQKLLRAYQLWRSPNVLAGAEFTTSLWLDAWFSNIANYSENLYRRILERLSDHEAATGNLESALGLARQALVNHELEEEMHVRVLRLLIQMGQNKEARAYFKEVRSVFQKELNSQPGPEIMSLYQQISSDTRPVATKGTARWNIHSSLQVPFVGRQKYLLQLRQAYQKGGGIFILGESGQGKTRLLQEFTSQLQPSPRLILARCRPTEKNLPFQSITDVLRQATLPKEWLSLPLAWANQLQVLFPELTGLRSDLTPLAEAGPEQARAILLEGVRQLFLLLEKSQRLLFVLDDGQWADEASLAAITYLIGRPPFDKQALLIFAARQEEDNPHLEKLLALLNPSNGASILQMFQMDLNEIDDLTNQVLGASPSPTFVARLAQDTGGNPFFILETLHSLVRQYPNPDLDSLSTLPLAESIYSLIQKRVLSLSPQARILLEIAAILGNEFSPGTLIKASGLLEDEVALSLEELEERLLIVRPELADQHPRYRFIHDKFREALLLQISPVRAQISHRKIAFTLLEEANEQSPSQAAILAYHFEAAGEWHLAYQHWVLAAQHARQLYAVAEASLAFSNAEKLIERCMSLLDDNQIYSLYREWGEMAYAANDTPALQAMNISLMRLGESLQSPLLKGTAFVRLGNACLTSSKLEEGLEYARLAIDLLSKTDNVYQLTGARTIYGVFLYMTGRVTEAIQVFEAALQQVKDNQDGSIIFQRASLNYEIGLSLILNGQPHKAIDFSHQSLQDHLQINNLDGVSAAYSELTLAEYFLGDYRKAFQYSQRGIEDARQTQSWRMLGYHADYRAMLELAVGNLDGMLEFAEKAIEVGRQFGQADIISTGYRLMADGFYLMEDYEKCLEYLRLAYKGNQKSFVALDTLYRMKSALFILDHKEEHIHDLQNIINQAETNGLITGRLLAQLSLAMAYRILQDWENARDLANAIKEAGLSRGFRSFVVAANLILAQCEWQAGNRTLALSFINESIQEAESIPFVWLEIMGRVLLARFYQQTGQPSEINQQRIGQLLEILNNNCQRSLFQSALQSFTKKTQQLLA